MQNQVKRQICGGVISKNWPVNDTTSTEHSNTEILQINLL